jgi:hypothetical protein
MLFNETSHDVPRLTAIRNRLCVEVPWAWAEEWQTRLRKAGIPTTLQLDPKLRQAHLEVWPGPDETRVRAALQTIGI